MPSKQEFVNIESVLAELAVAESGGDERVVSKGGKKRAEQSARQVMVRHNLTVADGLRDPDPRVAAAEANGQSS